MEPTLFKILVDNNVSPTFIKKLEGYVYRMQSRDPKVKGLSKEEYAEFRTYCERFTNHALRIMREQQSKLN